MRWCGVAVTVDGTLGMATKRIFETALGFSSPGLIGGMNFGESQRKLTIRVDFEVGRGFAVPGRAGGHLVHDTLTKPCRHLNSFHYGCVLEVRIPRVRLPGRLGAPDQPDVGRQALWFTLLFEAFVLVLARATNFTGAARLSGLSVHRVMGLRRVLLKDRNRLTTPNAPSSTAPSPGCLPARRTASWKPSPAHSGPPSPRRAVTPVSKSFAPSHS